MTVNFKKHPENIIPAIVQDISSRKVLMLGYMNSEALEKTKKTGYVTFFSRSKQRLWTKGEVSKNFLEVISIKVDCDNDSLLIYANPKGPTCHKGSDTCWGEKRTPCYSFISELENIITQRKNSANAKESYVKSLFEKGINKIAQKVGEEAVELVIEAKDNNETLFLNEAADLLFHYLILLQQKGHSLKNIEDLLKKRHEE